MTGSPALHHGAHHDSDSQEHECVVTLFAHGGCDGVPDAPPSSSCSGGSSSEIEQLRNNVEELKTAPSQTKSGAFNPDISAGIDFIISYSKEANQWNFTLRDVR